LRLTVASFREALVDGKAEAGLACLKNDRL